MLLRPPFVEHVRCSLLVFCAVGEADGDTATPFVEPPGMFVGLKDPEREPVGSPLFHLVEQSRADAATDGSRHDVEMTEHVSGERGEALDPVAVVDEDLILVDDTTEEGEV